MTARNRNVKESDEQYSPPTNRPHPSMSQRCERASKLVLSLHEGVGLVNREARTVFVLYRLAAMLRFDVDEVIANRCFRTAKNAVQRRCSITYNGDNSASPSRMTMSSCEITPGLVSREALTRFSSRLVQRRHEGAGSI